MTKRKKTHVFLIFLLIISFGCTDSTEVISESTNTVIPVAELTEEQTQVDEVSLDRSLPAGKLEASIDNGFGDSNNNSVVALDVYKDYLYASVMQLFERKSSIWRFDGETWSVVLEEGLNNGQLVIEDFLAYKGYFYAGTTDALNDIPGVGGEVWRTEDGFEWIKVFGDEIENNDDHTEIGRLFEFNGEIFVSTWTYNETPNGGLEIWKSKTGEIGSWVKVASNGIDNHENLGAICDAIHDNKLFIGTVGTTVFPDEEKKGWGHVFYTRDGENWERAGKIGNGEIYNVSGLAELDDHLYASLIAYESREKGGEIYRCSVCDGSDWELVFDGPYTHDFTGRKQSLEVYEGILYYLVGNQENGVELWRTHNGTDWENVASEGINDKNNMKPYWDNSMVDFRNKLYFGMDNFGDSGTQVWVFYHE